MSKNDDPTFADGTPITRDMVMGPPIPGEEDGADEFWTTLKEKIRAKKTDDEKRRFLI